MALQYSGGTIVDSTFTCTSGTRREIVDGLVAALANAGWSYYSGQGTGDVVMQCATTPQSLRILMRVYDPGSGSCARVMMRDLAGLKTSTDYYLLPAANKVYRVLASKYQFVIWVQGSSVSREFVIGGTFYIPSFLQGVITGDAGWINGNAKADNDTSVVNSLRYQMHSCGHYSNWWSGLINNNMVNSNGHGSGSYGDLALVSPYLGSQMAGGAYRWHDDSVHVAEALISFGLPTAMDEGKIRGQLWNAIILSDTLPGESTITFDGHTWVAITHNNNGASGSSKGTLMIAKD